MLWMNGESSFSTDPLNHITSTTTMFVLTFYIWFRDKISVFILPMVIGQIKFIFEMEQKLRLTWHTIFRYLQAKSERA